MSGLAIEVTPDGAIVTAEGLTLTDDEQARLHDAVRAEVLRIAAARETAPHPVHLEPAFREERLQTWDPGRVVPPRDPDGEDAGGPYWWFEERTRLTPIDICPDCRRPIQAGNTSSVLFDFLVCPAVPAGPLGLEDRPCHPGCLVACGVTRG